MNEHLTYGKVNLRPLEPDDIDLLYHWENSMEIWEVSNTKTPFSPDIYWRSILLNRQKIYTLQNS